jgi:hypothetical protein
MTTRSVRAKSALGYVPQDLAIYPDLTGRENLMFFARLYSMPTPEAKRRTDEVLALTGLADRAGDQTKQYSGGMKRRLNIGIGLLHQPKLLILDEPTVGVDPQSRNAILESVEGLSGGSPTPPPQAWGNDAFARLVGHGASIAGILPQLGVLAAYAAVLLTLAAWRLRRVLSC